MLLAEGSCDCVSERYQLPMRVVAFVGIVWRKGAVAPDRITSLYEKNGSVYGMRAQSLATHLEPHARAPGPAVE